MPKRINLTGTPGKEYDLDELKNSGTRDDSSQELIVQIWYWNPNGITSYISDKQKFEDHKKPNPPKLKVGQIWLSRWVPEDFKED